MSNLAPLEVLKQELSTAKDNVGVLKLSSVRSMWIDRHAMVTGASKQEAEAHYEAEQIIFAGKIAESTQLQKCDKLTVYAAWILHSISGLSFKDDQAYIVSYKGRAQWLPGWKGRLHQISQRPTVSRVYEPQIVYDCDTFDYERTDEGVVIHSHRPKFPRPDGAQIHFVYLAIRYTDGQKVTYMMDRDEVHNIRNQFSQSYKTYIKNNGKWQDGSEMEKPLAISNEAQYFRKTLVKRVYNNTSEGKSNPEKFIDDKIAESVAAAPELDDYEEMKDDLNAAFEIDGDVVSEQNGQQVNETTGEVATDTGITDAEEVPDEEDPFSALADVE